MFRTMKYSCRSIAILLLVQAIVVSLAAPSVEAKDGDVRRRVSCSRSATIDLKASPENGRIEVEAEVDEARPGHRWRVVLKKNGGVFFRGVRTVNLAGNIEVRRLTNNGPGAERIVANARNLNTGERCNVAVRFTS